jgi:sugar lactone lactonase YvrE
MRATVLCTSLAALAACQPMDRRPPPKATQVADTAHPVEPQTPPPASAGVGATKVGTMVGFLTPESVLYDSAQDIYFVSNVNGGPLAKDNNGFISRVRPDGEGAPGAAGAGAGAGAGAPGGAIEVLKFIEGGRAGATLNAPKGMAVLGDTLWVADIDVVRAFNARTGAPVDSVKLDSLHAVFLNDIAIAPNGAIYVTDTGIRFDDVGNVLHPGPDRVFRIGPDRKVTTAVRGDSLGWPNGITLDAAGRRFIIVQYGGKAVLAWKPGDRAPKVIAKGVGAFDGVEVIGGKIVVSSWADSSITRFDSTQGTKIITGVPSPADIGYDAKRNRVLIPIFTGNRVEIWQLH